MGEEAAEMINDTCSRGGCLRDFLKPACLLLNNGSGVNQGANNLSAKQNYTTNNRLNSLLFAFRVLQVIWVALNFVITEIEEDSTMSGTPAEAMRRHIRYICAHPF